MRHSIFPHGHFEISLEGRTPYQRFLHRHSISDLHDRTICNTMSDRHCTAGGLCITSHFFSLAVGCNGIAARAWASPHAQTLLFDNALTTRTTTAAHGPARQRDFTDMWLNVTRQITRRMLKKITTPARTFRGGVVSGASRTLAGGPAPDPDHQMARAGKRGRAVVTENGCSV